MPYIGIDNVIIQAYENLRSKYRESNCSVEECEIVIVVVLPDVEQCAVKGKLPGRLTQKDNLLHVCWTRTNGLDVLPREDNKDDLNKAKKDLAQHTCTLQQTLYSE